jgi:hypothetical protein
MTEQSDAGSVLAAETIGLPADLAELARLKARAAGLDLEDYVRALVAADTGAGRLKSAAK